MRISLFSINIYFSYKKQPGNKGIQKVKIFKAKNDIVFKKLHKNPGKIGKVLFVCLVLLKVAFLSSLKLNYLKYVFT